MKQLVAMLVALVGLAGLARAEETLIRLDDPSLDFSFAAGRQMNVRFAESFAAGRLPKADVDGALISDAPEGRICFFAYGLGVEPDGPELKDVRREEEGDFCMAREDVWAKYTKQVVEGAPPVPVYSTDRKACNWIWKTGQGVGLWTEECKFDSGLWNIVYDAANDWFALQVDGADPYPVLRQFHVEGGPRALLPELKAKGLVLDDAECVFAPFSEQLVPAGWSAWEVVPTGKRKEAFDAQSGDEVPDPPCGELGLAVDFVGFFMVHKDFPDRVYYVSLGQDGTMIDLPSVTLSK